MCRRVQPAAQRSGPLQQNLRPHSTRVYKFSDAFSAQGAQASGEAEVGDLRQKAHGSLEKLPCARSCAGHRIDLYPGFGKFVPRTDTKHPFAELDVEEYAYEGN